MQASGIRCTSTVKLCCNQHAVAISRRRLPCMARHAIMMGAAVSISKNVRAGTSGTGSPGCAPVRREDRLPDRMDPLPPG